MKQLLRIALCVGVLGFLMVGHISPFFGFGFGRGGYYRGGWGRRYGYYGWGGPYYRGWGWGPRVGFGVGFGPGYYWW